MGGWRRVGGWDEWRMDELVGEWVGGWMSWWMSGWR